MIDEDLSVFFDTDEFAREFVFEKDGHPSVPIVGIWDNAYADPVGMESGVPLITCPSGAAGAIGKGWKVHYQGRNYRVRGPVEHDGTGVAQVMLEPVP